MSRSNPTNGTRNPATRFFEWAGAEGCVRYYDKEKAEKVNVELPFTFLLLDQLSAVRGWHEESKSGIFSNEVRDTRQETLLVRSFKGGELASGLYQSIRDRVKAKGGRYHASLYIAYKLDGELVIGNLQLKGAMLAAWMEFTAKNKVYAGAVTITDCKSASKGGTKYKVPVFKLSEVSEETDAAAKKLDQELQEYLSEYLRKPREDQARQEQENPPESENPGEGFEDDDIPF